MLQVKDGGTGAPTAAGARINLGLGPDSSVTFTNLTLTGDLTVGDDIIVTGDITVKDSSLFITGSSDATKILKFEVDGFTTATTRTITVPNTSDTIVVLALAQTLTNKAINSSTFNGTLGAITPSTVAGTTGTFSSTVTAPDALFTAGSDLKISGLADTTKHNIRLSTNLIISPANAGDLYLNYDSGTGITRFADGATNLLGSISTSGVSFSTLAATFATGTFSGAVTTGDLTVASDILMYSANAAAGFEPIIDLFRDSASPTASDFLGLIDFNGKNNADTKTRYGLIGSQIVTSAAGSESGRLYFQVRNAGVGTNVLIVHPDSVAISGSLSVSDTATTRTNLGLAIGTNVQAWDADLDAIAASSGTGVHVRNGSSSWVLRTITGTANAVTVTNGDGVSGNPTIDLTVGALMSNTYVPTASTLSNVDSVSSISGMYLRAGNFVNVAGGLVIDATAIGVASFELTLPFGSDFTTGTQAVGTFSSQGGVSGRITSSAANNRAIFTHTATSAAATSYSYHFMYQIL